MTKQPAHRILSPSSYLEQPWRNGLGSTTELLAERDSPNSFIWRISMAPVQSDGPFSDFSGYDRILVLLHGNGLRLCHAGREDQVLDQHLSQARFSGDWATEGKLIDGPIRDFNIMTRRTQMSAQVFTGWLEHLPASPGLHLLFAPTKAVNLDDELGQQVLMPQHLLVRAAGAGPIKASGAPLIWVILCPVQDKATSTATD